MYKNNNRYNANNTNNRNKLCNTNNVLAAEESSCQAKFEYARAQSYISSLLDPKITALILEGQHTRPCSYII
jgi:hypothetical protein